MVKKSTLATPGAIKKVLTFINRCMRGILRIKWHDKVGLDSSCSSSALVVVLVLVVVVVIIVVLVVAVVVMVVKVVR
ncbi:hypothetical protein ElyMa_002271800 [Elysia marginata]|uniref:Transmembrane protein n=1 Tax=Elysia marginata TaxID=1093978 RepID=A0AAV4FZK8_9GAST|nr:hypothetical protein ElyMa_002271800 [Elysia marginata]